MKKRFLGKATGHNDHHMMNIGGQRPKIGSNWPALICSTEQPVCLEVLFVYPKAESGDYFKHTIVIVMKP